MDKLNYFDIDLENIDIIEFLIEKYKSVSGSNAIDALLYSIYMGMQIVEEEKEKHYTLKR